MSQMRKSLIVLFISFGFIIGLIPAGAAFAETPYNVWVEGKRVTSTNAADVTGDGTVSYDDASKTLTLSNAKLVGKRNPKAALPSSGWSYHNAAILSKTPLTMVLKGENVVTIESKTTDFTRAIGFFQGGKIVGNGSLEIKAEVNISNITGIYSYRGDLSIGENADIRTNLNNSHPSTSVYANTSGVHSNNSLTISDTAKLHNVIRSASFSRGVEAGTQLTVQNKAVVSCDVEGEKYNGIECENMLIKDMATVNCTTANGEEDSAALYCKNSLQVQNNAEVDCRLEGGDRSHAIDAYGKTTISDQAKVRTYSEGQGYHYGVKYEVTLNDDAQFVAAGSRTALSHEPVINDNEKMVIKVSKDIEGTNATTWDGTSPLGGASSEYRYVERRALAYAVVFDDNHPDAQAPMTKYTDDRIAFPADPSRANHVFLGWNTAKDGSGQTLTENHVFTANTTLYAQWKKHSEVTFDHNYSGAPAPTVLKANGADQLQAFPPTPTRKGYRFSGWNTARDGSGTAITKDHVFTTDTTLYAQWLKSERGGNKTYGDYSGNGTGPLVNFDPNYADAPAAESKRADKNGKFAQLPAPKREGHLFLGWFKDKDGSGTALTSDHVFTNSETVYAKWADGKDALRVIMTIGSHDYLVNDVAKIMDTVPFIEKDRTFVPIRALAEAFGAEVIWDGNERSVTIKDGDKTVLMTIGDKSYRVNDESKEMDVAPFINKDNRTMIPVRFATEALGYQVDYQQKDEVAKVIFTRG